MAEEIVNKHIIFEFVYKKHQKNSLKMEMCLNFMVLGVKTAEIFEKNTKNPIWKNTKKAPRIRKNLNFENRAS